MSDLNIPHDEIKHTALVGKDNLGARIFHVETIGGAHYMLKVDKFGKGSVIAVAPHRAISKNKAEKVHSITWDKESELFKSDGDDQHKGIAELVASIKDKTSEIQQLKEINPEAYKAIVGITNELVHILKTTKDVNIKDVQNDKDFDEEIDSHLKDDSAGEEELQGKPAQAEKQHGSNENYAPGAVRNYADGSKAKKEQDGSWKKLPKTGLVTAKSEDGASELQKDRPVIRFPNMGVNTRPDQQVKPIENKRQVKLEALISTAKNKNNPKYDKISPETWDKSTKINQRNISRDTLLGHNSFAPGDPTPRTMAKIPDMIPSSAFSKPLNHPKIQAQKDKVNALDQDVSNTRKDYLDSYDKVINAPADQKLSAIANYKILSASYKKKSNKAAKEAKIYPKVINKDYKGMRDAGAVADIKNRGNSYQKTIEHEALHNSLASIEQKHGTPVRRKIVEQLLSQHSPDDIALLKEYVKDKGYKTNSPTFNEEVLTHSRDVISSDRFKNFIKANHGKGMSEEEKENYARKRINSIKKGHQKATDYAKKLTPETVGKSELNKNILDVTAMHGDNDVNHNVMNWVYGTDGLDLDGDMASWVMRHHLEGTLTPKLESTLNVLVGKHHEGEGFRLPVIHINDTAEQGIDKLIQAKMLHDESVHQQQSLIQPDEKTNLILDNGDGTGWYNIGTNLDSESTAMNHDCHLDCRKDDTVISLRRIVEGYHMPILTAVINNGYITSLKDRHGYKPNGSWDQIKNLIMSPAVKGIIEDLQAIHPGFKFQDLPMSMQSDINNAKPGMDTITSTDGHKALGDAHKDIRDAVEYANVKRSQNPTGWRRDVINDYKIQQAPKMALFTLGQLTSQEYDQLGTNNG